MSKKLQYSYHWKDLRKHQSPEYGPTVKKGWVTLAEGMQINIRSDGKYHMFEFDKAKDAEDEFVKWNQELEAGN